MKSEKKKLNKNQIIGANNEKKFLSQCYKECFNGNKVIHKIFKSNVLCFPDFPNVMYIRLTVICSRLVDTWSPGKITKCCSSISTFIPPPHLWWVKNITSSQQNFCLPAGQHSPFPAAGQCNLVPSPANSFRNTVLIRLYAERRGGWTNGYCGQHVSILFSVATNTEYGSTHWTHILSWNYSSFCGSLKRIVFIYWTWIISLIFTF